MNKTTKQAILEIAAFVIAAEVVIATIVIIFACSLGGG